MGKNNHAAWIAGAMAAPLAHFSGGSWLTLLVIGIIIGAISCLFPRRQHMDKGFIILESAAMVLLMASYLPLSGLYWPGKWNEVVVPGGILAVSLWASERNPGRVAGFLFPLALAIFVPVVLAAVKTGEIRWIEPAGMDMELLLVPVLLLPWIPDSKSPEKWYWGILIFGVLTGMTVNAMLSPGIASGLTDPFRQTGRTLTLGAASRFEPVISVFMTFAWFSLFALALSRIGKGRWIAASVAYGLSSLHWDWIGISAVGLTVFLWLYPVIISLKNFPKKSEKSA